MSRQKNPSSFSYVSVPPPLKSLFLGKISLVANKRHWQNRRSLFYTWNRCMPLLAQTHNIKFELIIPNLKGTVLQMLKL